MDHFIRLYDWMHKLPPTERLVFALVHSLTTSGLPCFATNRTIAATLNLPKSHTKKAVQHLLELGLLQKSKTKIGNYNRETLTTNPVAEVILTNS